MGRAPVKCHLCLPTASIDVTCPQYPFSSVVSRDLSALFSGMRTKDSIDNRAAFYFFFLFGNDFNLALEKCKYESHRVSFCSFVMFPSYPRVTRPEGSWGRTAELFENYQPLCLLLLFYFLQFASGPPGPEDQLPNLGQPTHQDIWSPSPEATLTASWGLFLSLQLCNQNTLNLVFKVHDTISFLCEIFKCSDYFSNILIASSHPIE